MYLQISNRGLVEPGALSLMGASVKDGDAIGKFGSGFKYALATLIRNGLEVRIFSGLREITLETRPETFREREFQVLWVDGVRTAITTETGKEWHVRDAIRELWSNALDEAEARREVSDKIIPHTERTVIAIEASGDVNKMVMNWEMFFAHQVRALHENIEGRIIDQPTTNFFRRGVWICEDRETVGLFSYDFKDILLPESRKIATSSCLYSLLQVLRNCPVETVWKRLLENRNPKLAEWRALANWSIVGYTGQKEFLRVFKQSYDCYGSKRLQSRVKTKDLRILWLNDEFSSIFNRLDVPNIMSFQEHSEEFEVLEWPIGFEEQLEPAIAKLAKVGVNIGDFPIRYCRFFEGDSPIAVAYKGTCYLTDKAFSCEKEMLMKALIEEWTHLQHNVLDHTVAQQHVYLNLIVSLIERN